MNVLDAGIDEVTASIWANVLDLSVERVLHEELVAEPTMTCFVQVKGEWEGAVVLEVPEPLATRLATAMFQTPEPLSAAEVRDAVGEITNMLAGNIKSLLPQPCRIGLPIVASGRDYRLEMLRTEPVAQVAFSCQGDTFVVTVLQQSDRS